MKKHMGKILTLVLLLMFVTGAVVSGMLIKEVAKQHALQKAGVTAKEATFMKSHLEYDDGMPEFEYQFTANGVEYDIREDANTGRIVSYETESLES